MTVLRWLATVIVALTAVFVVDAEPVAADDSCSITNPLACVDAVADLARECMGQGDGPGSPGDLPGCLADVTDGAASAGCAAGSAVACGPGSAASAVVGAAEVASDPLGAVAGWVTDGVTYMVTLVAEGVDRQLALATVPDLDAAWFVAHYNVVFGFALVLMVAAFVSQVLRGVVQSDPTALGRALGGAAVSVLGSFAVLGVVVTLVGLVDELSAGMAEMSTASLADFNARWVEAGLAAFGPAGWLVVLVFYGVVGLFALVLMWLVLMLRTGAIYVLCAFAPVAFAAYGWERTRAVLARWGQVLGGLIFSKLVMYVVFAVGANMLEGSLDPQDGLAGLTLFVQAMVVLVLATLAPWMTVRFFSWAGSAMGEAHSLAAPGNLAAPALGAAAVGWQLGKAGASVIGSSISSATGGSGDGGSEDGGSGGGAGVDEEQVATAALAASTGGATAAAGGAAGGGGVSSAGTAGGGAAGGVEGAEVAGGGGEGGLSDVGGGSSGSSASGAEDGVRAVQGAVGAATVDLSAPILNDTGGESPRPAPSGGAGGGSGPAPGGGDTVIGHRAEAGGSDVGGDGDG